MERPWLTLSFTFTFALIGTGTNPLATFVFTFGPMEAPQYV